MKKIMLILLLSPLLLINCNKEEHQISDEYGFLIGKWECTNCGDETEVIISKKRISINSYIGRKFSGKFNNLHYSEPNFNIVRIDLIKTSIGLSSFLAFQKDEKDTITLVMGRPIYKINLYKLKE